MSERMVGQGKGRWSWKARLGSNHREFFSLPRNVDMPIIKTPHYFHDRDIIIFLFQRQKQFYTDSRMEWVRGQVGRLAIKKLLCYHSTPEELC